MCGVVLRRNKTSESIKIPWDTSLPLGLFIPHVTAQSQCDSSRLTDAMLSNIIITILHFLSWVEVPQLRRLIVKVNSRRCTPNKYKWNYNRSLTRTTNLFTFASKQTTHIHKWEHCSFSFRSYSSQGTQIDDRMRDWLHKQKAEDVIFDLPLLSSKCIRCLWLETTLRLKLIQRLINNWVALVRPWAHA